MTQLLAIFFIIIAILNIILSTIKWIKTDENQLSSICGWTCAILYCISANF